MESILSEITKDEKISNLLFIQGFSIKNDEIISDYDRIPQKKSLLWGLGPSIMRPWA